MNEKCRENLGLEQPEVLTFTGPILGFEEITQYQLLLIEDGSPFFYLQALGCDHPCFVVCDPVRFVPEYAPCYPEEILTELNVAGKDELRCLAIVTIPGSFFDSTMNLKSPIVLNLKTHTAKQMVTDAPRYAIKQRLFDHDGTANQIC
jgi:flagellar assembly factor FliW